MSPQQQPPPKGSLSRELAIEICIEHNHSSERILNKISSNLCIRVLIALGFDYDKHNVALLVCLCHLFIIKVNTFIFKYKHCIVSSC